MEKKIENETEAALQVDATNAFNSLNRKLTLHNVYSLCPSFAIVLTIRYYDPSKLYINGKTLYSSEGTIQGEHLTMRMYGITGRSAFSDIEMKIFALPKHLGGHNMPATSHIQT